MADQPTSKEQIRPLTDRLLSACVAGCSCLTKTPDIQYHEPLCHYRLHMESLQALRSAHEPCAVCHGTKRITGQGGSIDFRCPSGSAPPPPAPLQWYTIHGSLCPISENGCAMEPLSVRPARTHEVYLKADVDARPAPPPDADLAQRLADLERALVYSAFRQHSTPQYQLPERVALVDNDTVEVRFTDDRHGPKVVATWPPRATATKAGE